MAITFDPAKRAKTLTERGLDFADADLVFAGVTVEVQDIRRNYGEERIICSGLLRGEWSSWVIRRVARIATSSA